MTGAHTQETQGSDAFRWSVRLYEQARWKRWVVFGCATLAGGFGTALFHNVLFGVLGFVMILGATAEFWLGASYTIDGRGVKARVGLSLTSMNWGDVKRVETGPSAVKLSPLAAESAISPFRGVQLRFLAGDRDRVIAEIKRHWEGDVRFLEG